MVSHIALEENVKGELYHWENHKVRKEKKGKERGGIEQDRDLQSFFSKH